MKKIPIVVIKLGTSSIVDESTHQPLLSILAVIVETAVGLRKNGYKVVIVSSGAIGVALRQMDLRRRPKHLPQVQALAAIGQCRLIGLWDQLFDRLGQTIAQVLLTRNDIADRTQYQNAQNTFIELLNMGIIPIVNENDTLAVTEIKFGDNDTLSAITAGMVQADYLFLMTDVDCLYDKNPRKFPDAKPIEVVHNIADLSADVSSPGSALGTGGMWTKIVAARLATSAGVTTIITRSSRPGNIASIVNYLEALKAAQRKSTSSSATSTPPNGTGLGSSVLSAEDVAAVSIPAPPLHTRFLPSTHPIRDRRFWLLHGLSPHGTIYIDHGAANALINKASGLLPVGIVDVDGHFAQQECVRLVEVSRPLNGSGGATVPQSKRPGLPGSHSSSPSLTNTPLISPHTAGVRTPPRSATPTEVHSPATASHEGREIGRALVNYAATEIRRIAGVRSTEIAAVLGYADSEYVALRENVALTVSSPEGISDNGRKYYYHAEAGEMTATFEGSAAEAEAAKGRERGSFRSSKVGAGLGAYVEG